MDKNAKAIAEDLNMQVGLGLTMRVGSDAYPYYISEVLPNGILGIVRADSCFDDTHPWEGGDEAVKPFDPSKPTEFYIKRRYGNWWEVTKDGMPSRKWTSKYERVSFGAAVGYRDPNF